jgi:hypothetical protein
MPPRKKITTAQNEPTLSKVKGLFDHVDAIYTNQKSDYFTSLSDADKKSYNNYMVNKFLSMNPHQLPFVNELQKYTVSPELHYAFFSRVIPRGKQFNKYIKGKKENSYETWLVDLVREHYCISTVEAIDYLDIFYKHDKRELRKLCQMYGKTEKELKKAKL